MNDDTARSAALAAACAALVTVPTLGPLVTGGERSAGYETVITPPGYAFTIWAPVFAGCVATTIRHCGRRGRTHPAARRTGWPLAGAYATNAAWSVAAQTRFGLTPALLPVATGLTALAHRRLQDPALAPATGGTDRVVAATTTSTGLLLGWTGLASTVNLAAGALVLGAERTDPRTVAASTIGLAAASGLAAAGVATSRNGFLPLAAGAGWGLITTALAPARPTPVRTVAGLGAAAVTVAASVAAVRVRRRPRTAEGTVSLA